MGAYLNGAKSITTHNLTMDGMLKVSQDNNPPFLAEEPGDAWINGTLQVGNGMVVATNEWGASLMTTPVDGFGSYDMGTGSFLLSSGTYPNQFTKETAIGTPWNFTSADVGKVIIMLNGAYLYGVAMIESVESASVITLETCGWNADVSGVMFSRLNDPISFTSPHLKVNNIGETSEWENKSLLHTGLYANRFVGSANGSNTTNMRLEMDGRGFTNVDTLQMKHTVGALAAGNLQKCIRLTIDDSGCSAGATAEVDGFKFVRTKGASTATVEAIHVGTDFSNALVVDAAPAENPGYGYTFVATTFAVTDTIANFTNAASNIQIFTANNGGILIGSDNKFSVMQFIASVSASQSITPTWQYSTGDGTWATLTVSDTTTGMSVSGKVSFAIPALWAKTAHAGNAGGGGAITNAFYMRITRTRAALATPPTESYFKVFQGASASELLVRGDGTIKPVQMVDVTAPVDSIYYSLTANAMVYKNTSGTVYALY